MSTFVRHDAIVLKAGTDENAFRDFMTNELMPFFKATYKKLTRISIANLAAQQLLKDQGREGRYLWVNSWTGPLTAISDPSFAGTQMTDINRSTTLELLDKLKGFGKRTLSAVYEDSAT